MLIYHLIMVKDLKDYTAHKDLGLCSPKALYDLDKDLFMQHSYRVYLDRAAAFIGKPTSQLTPEDILDYLDNSPTRKSKGFDSSSIFCFFIPFNMLHRDIQIKARPCMQLTIDSEYLKQFKVRLVMYGGVKPITWPEIEDSKFIDWVEGASSSPPTSKSRMFAKVPHIALLKSYQIPKKHIHDASFIK